MASQSDSNLFSMRIVSIDYYMAPPIPEVDPCYSTFHGRNVEEVPVIRIYGSTLAGQKTCLHVHREGAVLNRNFQPYESHIPYLLRFLVDYNLYGMGLLHLTKVKFRNPLPDHSIPREARKAGHSRWDIENNSCDFVNSEAVSHGETSQDPAIWLSTKVPTGWIWSLPAVDSQDLCMKRQSTCELEGDATVDEIVNQQFKMCTSLSQARPGSTKGQGCKRY